MTKRSGAASFGVAQNGSLVYSRGEGQVAARAVSLVWVDREGNEEPLAAQPGAYNDPRISPDGTRVALRVVDDSGNPDIHIYDIVRNNLTQLTFTAEAGTRFECCPVWMPDGERVVFASGRDRNVNLFAKNADGTGDAERLTEGPELKYPHDVTGDGRTVVFRSLGDGPGRSGHRRSRWSHQAVNSPGLSRPSRGCGRRPRVSSRRPAS